MTTAAEEKRIQFARTFNAILGNNINRSMPYPQTDYQINNTTSPEIRDKISELMRKKVKEATVKTKAATPGATSAADILKLMGKGTTDAGTAVASSGISLRGSPNVQLDLSSQGASAGGLEGLFNSITDNPITRAVSNNPLTRFGGNALNATLDAVSRPGYAVNEALNRASDTKFNGRSEAAIPVEAFHGLVAGLMGHKKTGFGDVINNDDKQLAYADNLRATGNPQLMELGDKITRDTLDKTGFEQWSRRGVGLTGDILTDPTTYFTGGLASVEKVAAQQGGKTLGKQAVKGTLLFGKDALKNRAATVIKKTVDEFSLPNTKKPRAGIVDLTNPTAKTVGSTVNKNLVDHITEQVSDKIDNMVYDMRKGGMIGGSTNDIGTIASTISEAARESYADILRRPTEKFASNLKLGKRYTTAERNALRKRNPIFGEWLDIAERMAKENKLSPDEIWAAAHNELSKKLEPRIREIHARVEDQMKDALLRIPVIEYMGKKIYLPKLGKVGHKLAVKAGEHPHIANINKAWRYSSWFPGYTTHISQKLKSMNVQAYDEFKDGIEVLLKDTTPDQRKAIHRAIQEDIKLPGIDGEIQQTIKEHYKQIYDDEIGAGARTLTATPYANNYVYNQIGKGQKAHPDFVKEWKDPKIKHVREHKNIDGFTSQDALNRGWHPEEDVGQALMARKAKSIRELSRINFKKDLVTHYGIKSSIHPSKAAEAGLVVVDPNRYHYLYRQAKLKPGEALYLHKDIEEIYKNYNDMVKYGQNAMSNSVVTGVDKVVKLFKTANTIYFPGFHVRNAISDIFMGMLDGVKGHRYEQIMRAMTHKDTAKLMVGGVKENFRKIYDSYLDNAATAGFFDSELKHTFDPRDLSTMKYMNSTVKSNVLSLNTKARNLSQHREDFGRLVHYYHALDDEMTYQLKKGLSRDVAWKNAEEAAIERVNKFKFDYNALTPAEQTMRRFGMPFYTYMRKATPVLLENILMNPKYFSRINKLQNSLAPSDEFTANSLPGWMQEMAYSELSSGGHVGFTDALFPTRTLHETFSNPITRSNPILQGLFEYSSGKDTFSGKPVGTGITGVTDILKNKLRVVSTWRSIESDTKPTIDKWAGFFGIPLVQVTEARQGQRLAELEFEMTNRITKINKALDNKGLKLRVTNGKLYLIQPKSPTADEIQHNKKPRYPVNDKEKVLGVYDTFDQLPIKL